ncbi:MAG: PepSY domain-containing protein [Phenylobacterium sp.]
MKRIVLAAALVCALGSAGLATTPVAAQPSAQAGRQAPLSRVLAMLAQRYPGKQLNTTMGESGGRPAYLIQWQMAKDGHVVVFVVDAESGQVIGQQGG